MTSNICAIILSASTWAAVYQIVCIVNSKRQPEFCSRVVTFVHGFLMAVFGINQCFSDEGSPIFHPLQPTTKFQYIVLVTSLGYFIVDLTWCLYYKTETRLMMSHHVVSCLGLFVMTLKSKSGGQVCCSLGAMEITNPLLQLRWFIRTYGYQNTALFASVELAFMVVFVFVRLGFGTLYFLAVVLNKDNSWDFFIVTTAMYVISWLFLINIYKYIKVKYTLSIRQGSLDVRPPPPSE